MTFWVWFKLFLCGFDEGKDLYGHLPGISGYHWCFKLDKHNIPIKTPAGHARGSWPFLQTNLKNKITKHEKHTDLNTKTRTKTPNTSFTMMLTHSAPVTLPRHGCRRPSIANTLLGSYPPPGNTCNQKLRICLYKGPERCCFFGVVFQGRSILPKGWTNPSEKYARSKWIISPSSGEHKKSLKPPPQIFWFYERSAR